MSQSCEMEHFARKKKTDENCYLLKFKTIFSHFPLERGPLLNLSFYNGHPGERGKSVAVVDG